MSRSIELLLSCVLATLAFAQGGPKAEPSAQKPPTSCLSYEPAVVRLTGTLVRKTFPGPPNYESVSNGDAPEVFWLLELSPPICVHEDKAAPDLFNSARENVQEIQLVVDAKVYKTRKKLVGKRVVAVGTLFGAQTIHHRTDVLLMVNTLSKAK